MFDPSFTTPHATAHTDDRAWLAAMLRIEGAIARAGAACGHIPANHAETIASACEPGNFDAADIAQRAIASATAVVPLVEDLRALVGADAAPFVHLGATSQDVVDTALVLITRQVAELIDDELRQAGELLAGLAERHRATPQIGRTLLQQAVPTTFGAVCAGWLAAVAEAREGLGRACRRLTVQYGGPVGIGDSFDDAGKQMTRLLADELDLPVPRLPWHTRRQPILDTAAALAAVCGALATIATAVVLLSQNEIGELAEGDAGVSSAMPHKHNPARSTLILACSLQVPGLLATISAAQPVQLQRSAGNWQAEAPTLIALLRLTTAAAAHVLAMLPSLHVDTARMTQTVGDRPVPYAAAGHLVDRALEAYSS